MMPNLRRVLYSSHIQPCGSKWSSILLHQSCIMRACFKLYSSVDPITADSYIKRRVLCISIVIRYALHMQTASFLASYFLPLCSDLHSHLRLLSVLLQRCPDWGSDRQEEDEGEQQHSFTAASVMCLASFLQNDGARWWEEMRLHPSILYHLILLSDPSFITSS